VDPWTACPHCRRTSTYLKVGPIFKGDGWTPKHHFDTNDLPPYDEVRDRKREAGLDAPDE
jgi:hypothetical protein